MIVGFPFLTREQSPCCAHMSYRVCTTFWLNTLFCGPCAVRYPDQKPKDQAYAPSLSCQVTKDGICHHKEYKLWRNHTRMED